VLGQVIYEKTLSCVAVLVLYNNMYKRLALAVALTRQSYEIDKER